MHHEVQVLPDGRVLYVSRDVLCERRYRRRATRWASGMLRPAPARSYGTSSTPCRRPIGWSRRRTGRCRATLCGAAAGGSERDRQVQDWSHGNSAGMAADGSVLISLGHLNQVISIAPDSGPVRRRLGGSGSAFTFADPRDRFYPPHTALPLANGNVLLFDNGTGRPYAEGSQYSRALELELGLQRIVTRRARESGPRCTPRAAPACSACPTAPTATPDPVYGSSRAERCCRVFIIVEGTPDGLTASRDPEFR